jgi:hypothetical protein
MTAYIAAVSLAAKGLNGRRCSVAANQRNTMRTIPSISAINRFTVACKAGHGALLAESVKCSRTGRRALTWNLSVTPLSMRSDWRASSATRCRIAVSSVQSLTNSPYGSSSTLAFLVVLKKPSQSR